MAAKKRGLGKGLDALLGTASDSASTGLRSSLDSLAVDLIQRGQYQPRKDFDNETLQELANSIKAQGMVQPIVVRKLPRQGSYEIIAGERRWRAAQLAGLHEVPVVIKDVSDQAAMCMALIENIQRQDLNPLEEAGALSRLIEEFDMTHEAVAESVGRSRSAVSNLLRLLELAEEVKTQLVERELEMGHARALLPLTKPRQVEAARTIAKKGLSVREAEALVKRMQTGATGTATAAKQSSKDANITRLESELADKLGAKVDIKHSAKGKGELKIHYNSADELEGILKHIK